MDRAGWHSWVSKLFAVPATAFDATVADRVAPHTAWHAAHPVGDLTAITEMWLAPLRQAIPGAVWRPEITMTRHR